MQRGYCSILANVDVTICDRNRMESIFLLGPDHIWAWGLYVTGLAFPEGQSFSPPPNGTPTLKQKALVPSVYGVESTVFRPPV